MFKAIFFLQIERGLPCLPTHCFHGGDEIPDEAQTSWQCLSPVSFLLHRFFTFFAWEFEWGMEVVSVRVGQRMRAQHYSFGRLRGRFESRLHIEDPFLAERNLHCVLRRDRESVLHSKFCEAAQDMRSGRLPNGLRWYSSPEQGIVKKQGLIGYSSGAGVNKAAWQPKLTNPDGIADESKVQVMSRNDEPRSVRTDGLPREPAPEEVPPTTLCHKHAAHVQCT